MDIDTVAAVKVEGPQQKKLDEFMMPKPPQWTEVPALKPRHELVPQEAWAPVVADARTKSRAAMIRDVDDILEPLGGR